MPFHQFADVLAKKSFENDAARSRVQTAQMCSENANKVTQAYLIVIHVCSCENRVENNIHYVKTPQQAHDVKMTSYQRRCAVASTSI